MERGKTEKLGGRCMEFQCSSRMYVLRQKNVNNKLMIILQEHGHGGQNADNCWIMGIAWVYRAERRTYRQSTPQGRSSHPRQDEPG